MMLLLLRLFPDPQLETPPRPRDNFYEPEHPNFGRLFLLGPVSRGLAVLIKVKQLGGFIFFLNYGSLFSKVRT